MVVCDEDKLDLFLLAGAEELERLVRTLLEQPTSYMSHMEKLKQHFEAHQNFLELHKFFNIKWPTDPLKVSNYTEQCYHHVNCGKNKQH